MCDENMNLEEQVTEQPVEPKVETEPLFEEGKMMRISKMRLICCLRSWNRRTRTTLQSDSIKNTSWRQVLYALKDFLIKRLGSLLEHTT